MARALGEEEVAPSLTVLSKRLSPPLGTLRGGHLHQAIEGLGQSHHRYHWGDGDAKSGMMRPMPTCVLNLRKPFYHHATPGGVHKLRIRRV
ncbi:hypothetical protein RUM43_004970 [Polyplax serrata]|uniref:Uncharacterized protein n=1 Tax=Polyplax serrata TaxID=468196 RepID=A0AAN8XMS1_POLSC